MLQVACLSGLVEAKVANATATGRPTNFDEWIMRVMGKGIADLFMRPYNFKVTRDQQQMGRGLSTCTGASSRRGDMLRV